MKSKVYVPGGSSDKERAQRKACDPLGGLCLCHPSLGCPMNHSDHTVQLPSWGFLLSCHRKYPSSVMNVQTTKHHLKDHAAGNIGEVSHGLAAYSPALISVTRCSGLIFTLPASDSLVLSTPREQLSLATVAAWAVLPPFPSYLSGTSKLVHPFLAQWAFVPACRKGKAQGWDLGFGAEAG